MSHMVKSNLTAGGVVLDVTKEVQRRAHEIPAD